MAPYGTLYTWPGNPRIPQSLIAAKMNNLEIVLPEFKFGKDNIDPAWISKFPMAKVPALETHTEPPVYIAESAAIAHYLADVGPAREQLLGATPAERGRIQQWIFHAEEEVMPHVFTGLRPKLGRAVYDAELEAKALSSLERIVKVMEKQLEKSMWLADTEGFSMADLSVAGCLNSGFKLWLNKEWRDKYPKLMEWYNRLSEDANVKEVYGEQVLLE
ncbi:glutathione S-transferase [Pyronema domesticum]|nr:glutathione S-transferase [Pyronema domesticum]